MTFIDGNQVYGARWCSDDRAGLALEVFEIPNAGGCEEEVLEIFSSDADSRMTFNAFRANLPVELIAWSLQQACKRLPAQPCGTISLEIVE